MRCFDGVGCARGPGGPGSGRAWGALAALTTGIALLAGCARGGGGGSGAPEVRIAVTDDGFQPQVARVARGRPVTLLITRRSDHTCATEVVFENGGARVELPLGREVRVELPALGDAAKPGPDTLRYACGMDMFQGMIVAK